MAGAVTPTSPAVGDFVGLDVHSGEWLFVNAVDLDAWCVQIGPLGASSPWLDEVQAQARYNYTWGARNAPPTAPAPAPAKCECGTGDHTRSGAHSHWCPMWVAP